MYYKIPGFSEYLIDKKGNVFRNNKKIKPLNCQMGYLKIHLWKNGKMKNARIHRLMGLVFLNVKSKQQQINHIDGNKCNNKLENLEVCTAKQNIAHAAKIGKHNKNRKKFMTQKELDTVKDLINRGFPCKYIAKVVNRSLRCIQYVKQGNRGFHVSK